MADKKKTLNPLQELVVKTPEQERDQALVTIEQFDNLADLSAQLQDLRERAMVVARKKDIEYIDKMDGFIDSVLSALVDNTDVIQKAIVTMLEKGDMKQLKELMVAFGIAVTKREELLGFDDSRSGMGKKKLKLQVMWKGSDGSTGGVKVEA